MGAYVELGVVFWGGSRASSFTLPSTIPFGTTCATKSAHSGGTQGSNEYDSPHQHTKHGSWKEAGNMSETQRPQIPINRALRAARPP